MSGPTTFPSFGKLPFELQDQIWEHAIAATPARIILVCNYMSGPVRKTKCPVPSLLQVTSRPRNLMSKRWILSSDGKFYYNPSLDTIHLPSVCAPSFTGLAIDFIAPERVQKMAMSILLFLDGSRDPTHDGVRRSAFVSNIQERFQGLKELNLVVFVYGTDMPKGLASVSQVGELEEIEDPSSSGENTWVFDVLDVFRSKIEKRDGEPLQINFVRTVRNDDDKEIDDPCLTSDW